tara:strand:- start:4448 stop:4909 length:462 start_codon:yes stop_codon:yes gene_type:complete
MTYEDGANLVFGYLNYSVLTTLSEIELLIQSMSIAGATADTIRQALIYDLNNGGRIFGSLTNGLTNGAGIGITTSSQIAQLIEYSKAGVKEYRWIACSKDPCFNCAERAGRTEEMAYWELIGLPRSGFSVCRGNCKCHLEPSGYSGKTTVILD